MGSGNNFASDLHDRGCRVLSELKLQNFRCFDEHVIPLRPCTVTVGKNNAASSE
jgi:hypothetical protein